MSTSVSYPDTVAAAVRDAIAATDLSVLQVANGSLIPQPTLHRKLAGRGPFTVEELARIAGFLEIPVYQLSAPGVAA
jgi:hypothetical protein